MKHLRDFADIMHAGGKKVIIHMCGHLYNLMEQLRKIDLDGIHALTPPPIGYLECEQALDTFGDDFIIISCLDSTIFQNPYSTRQDIENLLEKTFTKRVREARFILWPVADGLSTDPEKFIFIKDWIDKNGCLN